MIDVVNSLINYLVGNNSADYYVPQQEQSYMWEWRCAEYERQRKMHQQLIIPGGWAYWFDIGDELI